MTSSLILALDQGTTSSRAMLFDASLKVAGEHQIEFAQHFPADGYVEHEPEDIWTSTLDSARGAMAAANVGASAIAGIGITNQRETVIIWDKRTGKPIHRAIVWQDRRTSEACAKLRSGDVESLVTAKTGLLLDPYFSASKIAWLLDNVDGARAAAEAGHLAFGTVDTWLLWKLTGGKVHATDVTNACRTLLCDIERGEWDTDMLRLFRVPAAILPEIKETQDDFGTTEPALLGGPVPIYGVAGDQQAATIGQACFQRGMLKATYGTGCFAVLNTGDTPVRSRNRLLTTIAYQIKGKRTYALEGSIFIAGAAVQWLRDSLRIVATAAETGDLAAKADPSQEVILVPAFVGLGAPQWRSDARGAVFGLTRGTTNKELARAALEATGFQTCDLINAMRADWEGFGDTVLRVDGGMTASDFMLQFMSDMLNAPVDRPVIRETTALGAAWLAGSKAGVMPDQDGFAKLWKLDRRFEPSASADAWRERRYAAWQRAVAGVIAQAGG